jgi:hypothetical protein
MLIDDNITQLVYSTPVRNIAEIWAYLNRATTDLWLWRMAERRPTIGNHPTAVKHRPSILITITPQPWGPTNSTRKWYVNAPESERDVITTLSKLYYAYF